MRPLRQVAGLAKAGGVRGVRGAHRVSMVNANPAYHPNPFHIHKRPRLPTHRWIIAAYGLEFLQGEVRCYHCECGCAHALEASGTWAPKAWMPGECYWGEQWKTK